jgi:CheY-like chemotaxis protein
MRILMIDDDEDIREVLGLVLRAQGHEVREAADGAEALTWLRAGGSPSVILLDMMMPRLDGEAFMTAMHHDPGIPEIPVIVVSGHQAARQRAQELGAASCLVKPIELEDLLAALDRAASGREART